MTVLPFAAEIGVHRIGGPDLANGYPWERDYTANEQVGSNHSFFVGGLRDSRGGMQVTFQELQDVGEGWAAGTMILADINLSPIGRGPRPCLLYTLPWDVPTMTHFVDPWLGHYVVMVRAYGSPADARDEERTAELRREDAARAAARREP